MINRILNQIVVALLFAALLLLSGCNSQDYSKDFSDIIPLNFSATADVVEQFENTAFGNSDCRIISGEIGGECRVGYEQCESSDEKVYSRHYYSFDESGTLVSIDFRSLAGTKDSSTKCLHWEQYVDVIEKAFGKWDYVDKSGRCELYGSIDGIPCKILYYPHLSVSFYNVTNE